MQIALVCRMYTCSLFIIVICLGDLYRNFGLGLGQNASE
jgi:hypothetical protein